MNIISSVKDEVEGTGANRVMLVGNRQASVNHFMLDRLMRRSGLDKDAFLRTNLLQPINQLIDKYNIKAIVPIGEQALNVLLGETNILRWRGRVVKHAMGVWAIPTFKPNRLLHTKSSGKPDAEILRNPPRYQGVAMWDLHKAIDVARNGYTRTQTRYFSDPSIEWFSKFADEYEAKLSHDDGIFLSWDIETPYKLKEKDESEFDEGERDSTIIRISFSFEPNYAVSVPWTPIYLPTIKRLLASKGKMIVWNGVTFDVPLVQANGLVVGGKVFDMMDAWHLLHTDIDKGLEFVSSFYTDILPWKHLNNSDPGLYSCIDADAALRNGLGINAEGVKRNLTKQLDDYVVEGAIVLTRAGNKGNFVDNKVQEDLKVELADEHERLYMSIQNVVPANLKPTKVYKKQPENPDKYNVTYVEGEVKACSHCKCEGVTKVEHFKGGKKNPCKAANAEIVKVVSKVPRWVETLDFNPASTEQLKNYMRFFGHPVGENHKTKSGESADTKHLEKLVKLYGDSHPLYSYELEIHKVNKTRSTYLPIPDGNNRIYTTYVNSTSTWRLGARGGPHATNVQNWGKRDGNKWAKRARQQIIASPDHMLVQADSSSIEAVMVGWFMQDEEYMRAAIKGIHALLVCEELGLEFNDANIKIAKEHPLYDPFKICNHMTNYGGTPRMLHMMRPDLYPSIKAAQKIQDRIFSRLPNLFKWHHELRVRAQKEGYLESPWGIRHEFYDVFTVTPEGKVRLGKDSKRVIAFLPQHSAGMFMRDNILLLDKTEARDWMPSNLSVHDGYCLDVPIDKVEIAKSILINILTRPIPQMGGLQIGCDVEIGHNWASYHKDKNPNGMQKVTSISPEPYKFK